MKFLDSNIILYAYLKPKPGFKITQKELNGGKKKAILFLAKILTLKNVQIVEVSNDTYEEALSVSISENLEPNDAIAVVMMRKIKCK